MLEGQGQRAGSQQRRLGSTRWDRRARPQPRAVLVSRKASRNRVTADRFESPAPRPVCHGEGVLSKWGGKPIAAAPVDLPPLAGSAEFRDFRPVKAEVMIDRETGKSRGFGFVMFETEQDKEEAIRAKNGAIVLVRKGSERHTVRTAASQTSQGAPATRDAWRGNNFFPGICRTTGRFP